MTSPPSVILAGVSPDGTESREHARGLVTISGAAVQVRGTVQAATAVDVHRVVLADGTIVDPSEVLYPVYHPTEGLSD